jgi:hypothetical protein
VFSLKEVKDEPSRLFSTVKMAVKSKNRSRPGLKPVGPEV